MASFVCSNTISVSDNIAETMNIGVFSSSQQANMPTPSYSLATGTGAGQVDLHWEKSTATAVTLASSASVTYTLSALTDDAGRSVPFVKIKKVLIFLTTRTTGDYLTVAPGGTHGWTQLGTFTVWDLYLNVNNSTAGWPVVASTTDQITVTNSGSNSITFQIAISGTHS